MASLWCSVWLKNLSLTIWENVASGKMKKSWSKKQLRWLKQYQQLKKKKYQLYKSERHQSKICSLNRIINSKTKKGIVNKKKNSRNNRNGINNKSKIRKVVIRKASNKKNNLKITQRWWILVQLLVANTARLEKWRKNTVSKTKKRENWEWNLWVQKMWKALT